MAKLCRDGPSTGQGKYQSWGAFYIEKLYSHSLYSKCRRYQFDNRGDQHEMNSY